MLNNVNFLSYKYCVFVFILCIKIQIIKTTKAKEKPRIFNIDRRDTNVTMHRLSLFNV